MAKKARKMSVQQEEKNRKGLKERFSEVLELPKELVLDLPKLTIVGNGDMMIENYKGIMEYGSSRIRVNTGLGMIKITGEYLLLKEITSEDILITGDIHSLEFIKAV
jgi:sporulation protein YqfC